MFIFSQPKCTKTVASITGARTVLGLESSAGSGGRAPAGRGVWGEDLIQPLTLTRAQLLLRWPHNVAQVE